MFLDPTKAVANKLGYADPAALILHLPLRYEDETRITPLRDAHLGDTVQVEGVVEHSEIQNRPRRQLVVQLSDGDSGRLYFRLLHFYPSQVALLKPGTRVRVLGEIRPGYFGAEMVHPQFRVVRENTPLPDRLSPVYPSVAGLSQYAIRLAVEDALARVDCSDPLPAPSDLPEPLPNFAAALQALHHPPPDAGLADPADLAGLAGLEAREGPAWRRIKYDELLAQQLSLRLAARHRQTLCAPALPEDGGLEARLIAALPFVLTEAQGRVLREIRRDLARPQPMNRMLQGDVGSGKTLVAALAALPALAAGHQVAVMAPTEILAEQLYLKFHEWLQPLGVEVAWLTAALKGKAKKATLLGLAEGSIRLAVGTHALFQNDVSFHDLALVIVDEQHRFGVAQRLALRTKGAQVASSEPLVANASGDLPLATGHWQPHLLMMSATPIPRSLAMSYFADLDVSVIDELPPGRTPIVTRTVSARRRAEVVARLRDYCLGGAQAYWVCPLVEESEKLQLRAVQESHAELALQLPELKVGLIHGRMKADEKAAVMGAFKAGELHLLVATTVIEVGVDVPNAALMVIEHAERYGLAQLHQLRGRVGRGARVSACVLLYESALSDTARRRLKIIHDHNDGFAIARADLALRGPGEFLGAKQSGQQMLRFADPLADADLLELARAAAPGLLEQYPEGVERHLERWLPRGLDLFRA